LHLSSVAAFDTGARSAAGALVAAPELLPLAAAPAAPSQPAAAVAGAPHWRPVGRGGLAPRQVERVLVGEGAPPLLVPTADLARDPATWVHSERGISEFAVIDCLGRQLTEHPRE